MEIRLFGRVEVVDRRREGAAAISLPAASKSLLAWLLLHRGVLSPRQTVAFSLFPDEPEETAFANLRRHIHTLSRKLAQADSANQWILADHQNIGWNTSVPLDLDIDAFTHACDTPGFGLTAAALYRGELAEEVGAAWIVPYRDRFQERFADACLTGAAYQHAKGDDAVCLRLLQTYLDREPWHESALRSLILVQARSGERLNALQRFDAFREELARGVNVELSANLLRAVASINSGNYEEPFPDSRRSERASSTASHDTQTLNPHLGSDSFRGRERHVQTILKALDARVASGTVAVVTGAAGIGKTRLAREIAYITTKHDRRTFSVTCAMESRRPYGPLTDLIALPTFSTQHELWLAIAAALNRLGGNRRTLIVIDDAHWADSATLELIRGLRNLRAAIPDMLLLYRSECEDANIPISEFRNIADVFLELGPLDQDELKAIASETVQGMDAPEEVLQSIAESSMGSPLLAQELARYTMLKGAKQGAVPTLPAFVSASISSTLERV